MPLNPDPLPENLSRIVERFNAFAEAALKPAATAADARRYFDAGLTLSDESCRLWLDTLYATDREIAWGKQLMNIVANAFTAIGGLNRVNPVDLGRFGVGVGALNASIDAFRAEFIRGAVPKIKEHVRDLRGLERARLLGQNLDGYDPARRALTEYHDTCSGMAIARLLEGALAEVRYVPPDSTPAETPAEAETARARRDLFSLLLGREGAFDAQEVFRIWTVLIGAPGSKSDLVKAFIEDKLTALAITGYNKSETRKDEATLLLSRIAQRLAFQTRLSEALRAEADAGEKAADAAQQVQRASQEVQRLTEEISDTKTKSLISSSGLLSNLSNSVRIDSPGAAAASLSSVDRALAGAGQDAQLKAALEKVRGSLNALSDALARQARQRANPLGLSATSPAGRPVLRAVPR